MAETSAMDLTDVRQAIEWQARHAEEAHAPRTARVVRAELAILDTDTLTGRRMSAWGPILADAMPLRVAGALHWLCLSGEDAALAPVYSGELTDQRRIDAIVAEMAARHDALLMKWLDGPPQTNEAGRSASVMAGLLWLSRRVGPKFELNEIGASAGINTMMDRYRFDLGGVSAGPASSPMRIQPEWRGPPPPHGEVEVVAIRGCDQAPVDLTDPAQALRLKAYVWPDATERMARLDTAVALARKARPDLVEMDAGAFVRESLAHPQQEGVTRVLFHSIVWQYIPAATRAQITATMEHAGALATPEKPLAWIALETNRETFKHELTVRYWPGGAEPVKLAEAHPHGAWVEWLEQT
jgi:hypothetical protein